MLHLGNLRWGVIYLVTLLAFLILAPRFADPANYDIESDTGSLDVQTTYSDADKAREKQECDNGPHTFVTTKDGEQRIAPYTIVGNETVVEGDIVIGNAAAGYAPSIDVASYKWPGGVVPFAMDLSSPPSTGDQPQEIQQAMAAWEKSGVVHFRPKDNDANFIIFKNNGDYCQSRIGMHHGGQLVEIGPKCNYHNILHEIGHALGLFHEHSRIDRNQHVKVLWDNIIPEERRQFCRVLYRKDPLGRNISNRYDFGSVMHYRLNAFSKCSGGGLTGQCKTLEPINPDELRESDITESQVGTRPSLSDQDLEAIRAIYGMPPPPPRTGASTTIEGPAGEITINNPRGPITIKNAGGAIKIYQPANVGRIWTRSGRHPHVSMGGCCGCCYPRISSCRWRRAPVPHYFGYWEEFVD